MGCWDETRILYFPYLFGTPGTRRPCLRAPLSHPHPPTHRPPSFPYTLVRVKAAGGAAKDMTAGTRFCSDCSFCAAWGSCSDCWVVEWRGGGAGSYEDGGGGEGEGSIIGFLVPIIVAVQLGVRVPTAGWWSRITAVLPATGGGLERGAKGWRRRCFVAGRRNMVIARKLFFVAEFVPIVPIVVAVQLADCVPILGLSAGMAGAMSGVSCGCERFQRGSLPRSLGQRKSWETCRVSPQRMG